VQRSLNEGQNCVTPEEFVDCMARNRGLKNTIIIRGDVAGPRSTPEFSIKGIDALNNFAFEEEGLWAWKAYGIGAGEFHSFAKWKDVFYSHSFVVSPEDSDQPDPAKPAVVYENLYEHESRLKAWKYPGSSRGYWQFWRPIDVKLSAKAAKREDEKSLALHRDVQKRLDDLEAASDGKQASAGGSCSAGASQPCDDTDLLEASKVFLCPEPGCTKAYSSQGRLDRHLVIQNHVYEADRESLLDYALGLYAKRIEARGLEPLRSHGEGLVSFVPPEEDAFEPLAMGWALFKRKAPARYTQTQKDFITGLFERGRATGFPFTSITANSAIAIFSGRSCRPTLR
jgi:hypothetical protein